MHENIKAGNSPHSNPSRSRHYIDMHVTGYICNFQTKFPTKYQWDIIRMYREFLRTGDVFNRRQRIVKDVVSARIIISAYIVTLKKIHGDGQLLLPIK